MPYSTFILLIAILIVGVFVFIAISSTGRHNHHFDVEDYQTRFLKIENSLSRENKLSYNAAVIEADKLLDHALMELGIPGKTMGERLKASSGRFSQLNSVWYAHKQRNQIAHEQDFNLEYNQAKHALASFRQALKDLGAI